LLVHDTNDAVIPYSEAEALAGVWPGLKLMTTTGLGHRDILANGEVLRTIVEFVRKG
jgi:pimeloyl-ACP methyl ester carboxylesterase